MNTWQPFLPSRYRYRTTALLGRWCDTEAEALKDALRAGQAARDADGQITLHSFARLESEGSRPKRVAHMDATITR
jgi:hypothetical protein